MICDNCKKYATDNPVAHYHVVTHDRPEAHDNPTERLVWKCWTCLSSTEKLERDGSMKDPRRFKMQKTIKEDV